RRASSRRVAQRRPSVAPKGYALGGILGTGRAPVRLGDFLEEVRVAAQGLAEAVLELAVDLADAALGHAEDLTDLAERHVLHVHQHRDLALALAQCGERAAELGLGLGHRAGELRVALAVGGGKRVDALDCGLGREDHRVERGDLRGGDLVPALAQLGEGEAHRGCELVLIGLAAVDAGEALAGARDVALHAAQVARGPVLAAQLVDHGAVDAGPRELLERGAADGLVAVDRLDQRLERARDQVLAVAVRRERADLLVDDVLRERRVGHDEPVAGAQVAVLLVELEQALGIFVAGGHVCWIGIRSPEEHPPMGGHGCARHRPSVDARSGVGLQRPADRSGASRAGMILGMSQGNLEPVQRAPRPLDPGVTIGHVHLRTADIDRIREFYVDLLGFDVMAEERDVPGWGTTGDVLFLSAGGYHHHLGFNTWKSAGGPPQPDGVAGLHHIAVRYPTREGLADALRRLRSVDWPIRQATDHGTHEAIYISDP